MWDENVLDAVRDVWVPQSHNGAHPDNLATGIHSINHFILPQFFDFKIIFSEFLPYLTKQTNDGKISNYKNSLDRTICIPALPSRRTRTGREKRRPGSSPSTTTFARDRLIFCSVVGPTNTAMMDVTIVWLKGLSRRISSSRATA